jgi:hypothetical protein
VRSEPGTSQLTESFEIGDPDATAVEIDDAFSFQLGECPGDLLADGADVCPQLIARRWKLQS